MALVLKDRVRESSSTSGTGTITLAGAATGFDSFASIGDGNTTYYAIIDALAGDWEVGLGTYTASGTTLSRDTVLESSNSDTLVNFAANSKDVICTYPADRSVFLSADGSLSLPGALSATGAVTGSNLNVSNWDTAYGWGDHSTVGYLTSYTETDPVYTASSWHTTTNNASNWDTAYGWGDHASSGYVVSTGGTMTGDLSFGDNNKAIFGAGSDLRIYHDGSNSYVQDFGTGNLMLRGTNLQLRGNSTNELFMDCVENGAVNLYYNNANKLATTNTGINVTGSATIDGILLQNSVDRTGLLEINRLGSTGWTGTQVRFSSTAIWSVMGNQTNFGIYDDYNSKWVLQHTQNAGISLYYGGSTKLSTTSGGVSVTGAMTASGNVTAYSDERLKCNWKPLSDNFIENLAGVRSGTYERTDNESPERQVGVGAQSLREILPEAVLGDESQETLSVAYGNAALASAIELAKKVVELEARIKELEVR